MAYSLLLRALLGVAIVLVVSVASKVGRIAISPETLRPHVERLIDPDALRHDPAYLALLLTWVSFLVAGFREELWRAGMFAGFSVLFPRRSESRSGAASIIVCVSVLFGLGHLVQGISAVVLTALLGVGLSMIMRKHRSIWEAVFAHGFFNAASFALLALTTVGAP
jgi:membrane protease YdiL (CAAX protease family)